MGVYRSTETGKYVTLQAQDEKSVCHFVVDGQKTVHTMPSHQFYAQHTGATAEQLEEREAAAKKAPTPA